MTKPWSGVAAIVATVALVAVFTPVALAADIGKERAAAIARRAASARVERFGIS